MTTTTTHTPGPWRWEMEGKPDAFSEYPGDLLAGDTRIIYAHAMHTEGYTVIQNHADARLIAAAPDLLAALIQAVDEAGFSLSGPTDWRAAEHGEPHWVCNARLVIAQAS